MSNFELKAFPGRGELARAAAGDWLAVVRQSAAPHLVALSGGRIAQNFFRAATELSRAMRVPLGNVEFFWGDERCVPPEDPDSNYRLAWDNFLQPLAIAAEKIHRLRGEIEPAAAVAEANATIGHVAPNNASGLPVLDLIFLGLGENGHIASLMPYAPASVNNCKEAYLHIDNSPKPPPHRLSLSYAAIAAAKQVWVLASGAGKEEALRQSLRLDSATPFGRVLQSRAKTTIYTDIKI